MSKIPYTAACFCNLRHPAKAVLKEMAWFADDAGENIWPSVKTLAERTGLSRRAIQKLLRSLEGAGAIRGLGSRLGGRQKTTRYRIDLVWVETNSERANYVRPWSPSRNTGNRENSEPQNHKRANGQPKNGEPRSPDKKDQKYEKYLRVLPKKAEEDRQALNLPTKLASPYEYQRLRQTIRKEARARSMSSPMTDHEQKVRRSLLKEQAEAMTRTRAARQQAVGSVSGSE